MSGPIEQTIERTITVCPLCENEIVAWKEIDQLAVENNALTLIALNAFTEFDGVDRWADVYEGDHICLDIDPDEGRAYVYLHDIDRIDGEILAQRQRQRSAEYEIEPRETHRERVKVVKQILRELQNEYDGSGAPEQRVIERAQETGMSTEEIDAEIQKLRDKGEIFSPDGDHLALV